MTSLDGQRLVGEQSIRNALLAGLIVIIIFCVLWTMLTAVLNRVLPWVTVLLGVGLGFTLRHAGRGIDWRFPLLAAVLALAGALFANVVLAAATTGDSFGVGTIQVLFAVTTMTWGVYFEEVFNVAHVVFALCGACLAAFLANRRLSRDEYFALRLWLDERGSNQG